MQLSESWTSRLSHGSQMGHEETSWAGWKKENLSLWQACFCEGQHTQMFVHSGRHVCWRPVYSVWTRTLAQSLFEVSVCEHLCLFEICSLQAPQAKEETQGGCHEPCHKTNNPSLHTRPSFLVSDWVVTQQWGSLLHKVKDGVSIIQSKKVPKS